MALEIEHKYLVSNDSFKKSAHSKVHIEQGYLNRDPHRIVRIRIKDNEGFITVKGITKGDARLEFEYSIPVEDAREMLKLCEGRIIVKDRYIVYYEGIKWEIDVFGGDLAPLAVAEVELDVSHYNYPLPPFIGDEVTHNPKYFNSNL